MYKKGIQHGLNQGLDHSVIARKIYLSFPTEVFVGKEEMEFELINSIKEFFKIPFSSIKVVGSSKIGYSYVKSRKFIPGESDLDVAIVDSLLFQFYCEKIFRETKGLSDLSKFGRTKEGYSKYPSYCQYLAKGMFRPDLMPIGETSRDWFNFFNKLSQAYSGEFSDINAGIYFSETFFEQKQKDLISFYKTIEDDKV